MKSWLTYILLAVLSCTLATSCAPDSDLECVFQDKSYVSLSRVVIPLDTNEHLTVESVRVLIFDGKSGNIISNTLVTDLVGSVEGNKYIITLNNTAIEAYSGTHDVYVVLNEDAFGANLGLTGVTTKEGFEEIREDPVDYLEIIAVPEGNEPPFLMCTYDKVTIPVGTTSNQPFVIDMTGLDAEDYGFSMRRTMAKIVLESIWGGVKPDGNNTILGTNIPFDPAAIIDQTGNGDIVQIDENGNMIEGNIALAATSEVFVTKVELLNVPDSYSWAQDKNNSQDQTVYTGNYLNPIDITYGFTQEANSNNLERTWHGGIIVNGTVDFSRTDFMPSIWRQDEKSSGSNSYGINEVYPFDNKAGEGNYSANGPFVLNSGNFVPWVKEVYGNGEYEKGEVVPENLKLKTNLNPAVWSINGNVAYYIPENVQQASPNDYNTYTKLRVYFCIGTIMAEISDTEIRDIIDEALSGDKVPIVGEGGETLVINKNDNWQSTGVKYVTSQGKFVANPSKVGDGLLNEQTIDPSKDKEWGICYEGLKTIWHGSGVKVTEREGIYYADNNSNFYIDVLLNNDEEKGFDDAPDEDNNGLNDHNIYRGHEYRVKLYVTRSNENWPSRSAEANSRSINIGGEELTITGKVVATPMK